jgi:hypothetical protein
MGGDMRNACFSLWLIFVFSYPALLAQAQAVDVSGDWELTMQTQRGEMIWSLNFVQDGEKVAVTMVGPRGNESKGEGTIKGNEIQWSVTRTSERGEFTITYNGKVDGATMAGQADMGGRRTVEWTAKKK